VLGKPASESDEPIGESWELSDHPEGPSKVAGGPFDGRLFGEVLRAHPLEMVGSTTPPEKFPLLVKYIDAKEALSIQVHPDDDYTEKHSLGDRGKTECWYIIDCEPDAEVIYGLKAGVAREDLARAVGDNSIPEVVRRVPICPGTFLYVPAGTVHALLGGTLLCEIQQSSNITYRLWDWNRQPTRQLHIQESLEVSDYSGRERQPLEVQQEAPPHPLIQNLIFNPYFLVQALCLGPDSSFTRPQPGKGVILNGVHGKCRVNGEVLQRGDTFFVPACVPEFTLETGEDPVIVLASRSNE
jgi:mannose-6-phosphate isomerase